jgi:hypothetical protein
MKHTKNLYTTIQITKDFNEHIKKYCKQYGVSASKVTELMWGNYISSSNYLKEIMVMSDDARMHLISSSMSGSVSFMGV